MGLMEKMNGQERGTTNKGKVFLCIQTIRKIFIYHYNVMEYPISITTLVA